MQNILMKSVSFFKFSENKRYSVDPAAENWGKFAGNPFFAKMLLP